MKFVSRTLLGMAVGILFAGTANAQLINLATSEHATVTTVFGYNSAGSLSTFGTEYEQNFGAKATMNDGVTAQDNANTTFGNEGGQGNSYGFGGYENLSLNGKAITSVNLYMNAFSDGGWFGPNGDFSASSPLAAGDLAAPMIQITTNNGVSWTTVATTDDYVATFAGHVVRGQNGTPEVTFNMVTPLSDQSIDGIRVIGLNGGWAGTGNDANSTSGFIAINELQIEAMTIPEPSTYAMIIAGMAVLGFCIRRKGARI